MYIIIFSNQYEASFSRLALDEYLPLQKIRNSLLTGFPEGSVGLTR
jgi:hypothetical protein